MKSNFGCLILVGFWAVLIMALGAYDVYRIAQLAARQELEKSC